MSNGSNRLTFRDLRTFEVLGDVPVTLRGFPLTQINELECVGDAVYANVYQTNFLVRINPETGRVTHQIDASGLLTREEARGVDVLNGIAFDPRRRDLLHHRQALAEDVRGDVRVERLPRHRGAAATAASPTTTAAAASTAAASTAATTATAAG